MTAGRPADAAQGNLSDAGKNLLRIGRGDSEGVIQDAISKWLAGIGVDSRPQYRTPAGPVDLHLMQRRCMIEVKRPGRLDAGPEAKGSGSSGGGGGGESALDQLKRHVSSSRLQSHHAGLQWRGAVTDGRTWWVWQWPLVGEGDEPKAYGAWARRRLTAENIGDLESILRRRGAGKPWAPDDPAPQFADMFGRFRATHRRKRDLPDTRMQQGLWLEQLKGGGNHPSPQDADGLFVVHTVLVLISRLVSGMRVPERGRMRDAALMHGFVGWAAASPEDIRALEGIVDRYDWRAGHGDVMRQLYMSFVPAEQRRSYGEYYTPDWLAEKVCLDVIDDGYIAGQLRLFMEGRPVAEILDPACGSGTFVYHAARRLLDSRPVRESRLSPGEVAGFVCAMVRGIDIHPVAVEMSVANMRRLLGDVDPACILVRQGDSLLIGRPEPPARGAGTGAVRLYTPGGRALALPRALLLDGAGIEELVRSARDGRPLPPGAGCGLDAGDAEAAAAAHAEMSAIMRKGGSCGAWPSYMRNQAAPLLLSGGTAVRRIVSNPPWVRLNKMPDRSRADSVRRLAADLGLYEGGKRATAFDIAALFVARCHDLYAEDGGARAAWILPQAAMTGSGQWERLRGRFGGAVEAMWDLGTLPFPQQGPSSAMIVGRGGARRYRMIASGRGGRPGKHDSWAGTAPHDVRLVPAAAAEGAGRGERASEWVRGAGGRQGPVRNGATLFPAPLVRVEEGTLRVRAGTASFTTRPGRHGAWKEIGAQSGSVPAGWIRRCVFGGDLVAFCAPTRTACVLPVDEAGRWLAGRSGVRFWRDAASLYAARRGGGRHTPATLEERLDYQGCLSWQFASPARASYAVYNKSGSRMYAAAIGAGEVIDNTLYSVRCASAAEARFVSALLNSDALQDALAAAKENQRHYDTYLWRKIPLPRFRRADDVHRRLAALARRAETRVMAMRGRRQGGGGGGGGGGRASSSEEVRKSGIMGEIDRCVAAVLPGYAGT